MMKSPKSILTAVYVLTIILSASYAVGLIQQGSKSYVSKEISYAGGAIASALICCTCLYLLHKIVFTDNK